MNKVMHPARNIVLLLEVTNCDLQKANDSW
jgi:hypothetical protein